MGNFDTGSKSAECKECLSQSPWPGYSVIVTFIPWPVIVCMGVYILYKTSFTMLGVWLAAFFLFFVPLRYLICARCPYYGKNCSAITGRMVPFFFAKRPGTPLAVGLWLDIVFFAILSLIPVPFAFKLGGALLTAAWLAVFASAIILLALFGCRYCPFTYCPIGKASRGIFRALGLKQEPASPPKR